MSSSNDTLWSFFVAVALGLTILVVALGAAIVIAQRRFLRLHQVYGRRLLAAQDEERADVAREVHDEAVQRLATFRHELHLLNEEGGLSITQRRRLKGLGIEVQDMSEMLRGLAHRLHPAAIDHGDLRLVLEQLAEETGRVYGVRVEIDCAAAQGVRDPDVVLTLFRIAQESLRNVKRHADVDRAHLEVRREPAAVVMVVRDAGRGFDLEARAHRPSTDGLGLLTIQERARLVGGTATVASRPGGGTTVRVTIPLGDTDRG